MDNINVPAVPATPAVNATPEVKAPVADNKALPVTGKPATDSKELSTEAKEIVRKIKVGEMEYDETTLQKIIEKEKGADKAFREASVKSKEAIKLYKLAKDNPKEFLKRTGHDPEKFAYDEVAESIKNKMRDPREVENERLMKENEAFKAQDAERKAKIQAEREEKAAKAFEQQLHTKMIDALEAAPSLPKNGFTVAKIAEYLEVVYNKTGTMLEPKDVVKVIERDIKAQTAGIVKGASAEQLLDLIGEEGMAVLRAHDLAKLKDPLKNGNPLTGGQKQEERPRQRSNDFWKDIDKAAKEENFDRYGRRIK